MIKKRYHFLIVGGILLIGIIIGSFLDLQINTAIFDRYNTFGLAVSAFGMTPGYGFLAFLSGVSISLVAHNKKWPVWKKILMIIVGVLMYGLSVYSLGQDIFNINGFYNPTLEKYYVGYIYEVFLMIPVFALGYYMSRKVKNPNMWIMVLIFAGVMFMALVAGAALLKEIAHRPRYRIVVYNHLIDEAYHDWWKPFFGYKDLKPQFATNQTFIDLNVTSVEFRSFPSGHSAAAMITPMFLTFLPYLNKKLMKYQTLFFYLGFGWTLVMMFARMLVGAHYLTDTCFGAGLTLLFFYIANEIVLRTHLLEEKKEQVEEQ